MKGWRDGYYYLHTNGQIIWKAAMVVDCDPCYFDSPFVVKYWRVRNEMEFDKMKVEAKDISEGCQCHM